MSSLASSSNSHNASRLNDDQNSSPNTYQQSAQNLKPNSGVHSPLANAIGSGSPDDGSIWPTYSLPTPTEPLMRNDTLFPSELLPLPYDQDTLLETEDEVEPQVADHAGLALASTLGNDPVSEAIDASWNPKGLADLANHIAHPQISTASSTKSNQTAQSTTNSVVGSKEFSPSENKNETRFPPIPQAQDVAIRQDTASSPRVTSADQSISMPVEIHSSTSYPNTSAATPLQNITTSWRKFLARPQYSDQQKGKSNLGEPSLSAFNWGNFNFSQNASYQKDTNYASNDESYQERASQTVPTRVDHRSDQRESYRTNVSSSLSTSSSEQLLNSTVSPNGEFLAPSIKLKSSPSVASNFGNSSSFSQKLPTAIIRNKSVESKAAGQGFSASSSYIPSNSSSYMLQSKTANTTLPFGTATLSSRLNDTFNEFNSTILSEFPCQDYTSSNLGSNPPNSTLRCHNSSRLYSENRIDNGDRSALKTSPKQFQDSVESVTNLTQASFPGSPNSRVQFNGTYGTSNWINYSNSSLKSNAPTSTVFPSEPLAVSNDTEKASNFTQNTSTQSTGSISPIIVPNTLPTNSSNDAQNFPIHALLPSSKSSTSIPLNSEKKENAANGKFNLPLGDPVGHSVQEVTVDSDPTPKSKQKWSLSVQNSSSELLGRVRTTAITRADPSKIKVENRTGTIASSSNQTRTSTKVVDSQNGRNFRGSLTSQNSSSMSTSSWASTESTWPQTAAQALDNPSYQSKTTFQVTKGEKIKAISVGVGFSVGILVLAILGGLLKRRALRPNPTNLDISRPKRLIKNSDEEFGHRVNEFSESNGEFSEDFPGYVGEVVEHDDQDFQNSIPVFDPEAEAGTYSHELDYNSPNELRDDDDIRKYISFASSFGNLNHGEIGLSPRDNYPNNSFLSHPRYTTEAANQRDTAGGSTFLPITFQDLGRENHPSAKEGEMDLSRLYYSWHDTENHQKQTDRDGETEIATRFSDEETTIDVPPVPRMNHHFDR